MGRVQAADVVLAVIGPHWAAAADDRARRSLLDEIVDHRDDLAVCARDVWMSMRGHDGGDVVTCPGLVGQDGIGAEQGLEPIYRVAVLFPDRCEAF